MSRESIIKKVASSRATGGGNYIKQGNYTFVVEALKFPEGLESGDTFIAELKVKTAEGYPGQEAPNALGSIVSYVQEIDNFKSAAGNVKAFIETLDGEKDSPDFGKILLAYTNDDPKGGAVNPGRGMEIKASTYQKPTRDGSKMLTLPRWSHIPLTAEQIQANIDWLDGKTAQPAVKAA